MRITARVGLTAVLLVSSLGSGSAWAKGEVTFVVGALSGGDINVLVENGFSFPASFKKSPALGLRVGSYGYPVAVEGSLLYGPASLTGTVIEGLAEVNANVLYTEVNLLILPLPGPVSPFVTGGVGLHYLNFDIVDLVNLDTTRFGFNLGGGVKVNVSRLALRLDVRDHVSTFGLDDVGLGALAGLLGLGDTEGRVHNVEVSFGLALRF